MLYSMADEASHKDDASQETRTMNNADTTPDTADTETLKRDFARLRANLDAVKDKLGDNAHEVLERLSAHLSSHSLGARLDNIEDELSHLGNRLKDSGRDAAAKLETKVTDSPFTSVAIAFGIGLLAANLLRRR
jgi:ElaB/YqjD/DUF883 family membrane-anchored ribosome-binding protein